MNQNILEVLWSKLSWKDAILVAFIAVSFTRETALRAEISDLNDYVRTTYQRVLEENSRALVRLGEK